MVTVIDVAQRFLELDNAHGGDGLTNLKLQKLAYYAQGFHLAITGEPLFSNKIEAWQHGPVIPSLYHELKEHGKNPVHQVGGGSTDNLTEEQADLLGEVFETFGRYSAWALREMTHEEAPWLDHIDERAEIPHNDLRRYFSTRLAA